MFHALAPFRSTCATPRRDGKAAGLAMALLTLALVIPSRGDEPCWIWGPDGQQSSWEFSTTFACPTTVQFATAKLAADFCAATVEINGQTALSIEPYCQAIETEVTAALQRGTNSLQVIAGGVEGPSAIALTLTLVDKAGRTTIVSDQRWTAKPFSGKSTTLSRGSSPSSFVGTVEASVSVPTRNLGKVRPELWGIGRRAATISPLENYEQWQQTKKDQATRNRDPKLWTATGFEITLLRRAAEDEGSWISMAFDSQGRLTISREDTGLLRMTLAGDRKSVARVEPIEVDLKECRGMLYTGGYLYAHANNSNGMYRVRIADDGRATDLEKLRDFPGKPGHGRNDLALGPDRKLYAIYGDAVEQPKEKVFDRTSPLRISRRDTPRGEGYLLRTDLEGKQWELICTGLRNAYGVAIHKNGDVFTYDADNEFDMGTPWYRPTRIVRLVSGADFGWRLPKGEWPREFPDHPDNGLPVIDVGRGSPTAAMFGTDLNFPQPYRDALFVLDWAYGRVVAVHLAERGAGYRAALELFLQGQPLNVTDLCAGPDGAMYLTTGGRKTQSSLYRVAYVGPSVAAPVDSQHERDCAAFARSQRELLARLEAFHGRADRRAIDEAWPCLADADPVIRHAARIAVEQLPLAEWQKKALGDRAALLFGRGVLQAAMAVAQAGDKTAVSPLLHTLTAFDPITLDLSGRFILLHLYRQSLALAPDEVANRKSEIVGQLDAMWPQPAREGLRVCPYGDSLEFQRRLALLLADLDTPGMVDKVCNTLLASAVQEDRLQGLLAMRNTREGWTLQQRRKYFETLNAATRFVGGQGMPTFVDKLRADALATLSESEKTQLADLLDAARPVDEPLPPARPLVQKWTLQELSALAADATGAGDADRGKKVFSDALCNRCHRSGIVGPAVGPDLTFVARRFSRRDMLESILAPSAVVAEQYRNAQIVTDEGLVHVGRIVAEGDFRSEKLLLATDPLHPGKLVEIDKKQIAEHRLLETSPMPQGLLDGFTQEEIRDLLAFLESGIAVAANSR